MLAKMCWRRPQLQRALHYEKLLTKIKHIIQSRAGCAFWPMGKCTPRLNTNTVFISTPNTPQTYIQSRSCFDGKNLEQSEPKADDKENKFTQPVQVVCMRKIRINKPFTKAFALVKYMYSFWYQPQPQIINSSADICLHRLSLYYMQ